jgi:hypothetical protein
VPLATVEGVAGERQKVYQSASGAAWRGVYRFAAPTERGADMNFDFSGLGLAITQGFIQMGLIALLVFLLFRG